MNTDLKILKGALMTRRLGITSQTKEELIEEQCCWCADYDWYADTLDDWIDSLREELAKTPEQREEESRRACEEMAEREAEQEYQERMAYHHDRDEWDDLWADRARSVGAVWF